MERPVVARLRDGQAQGRLASRVWLVVCRVCRAGLLIGPGAVAENDINQAPTMSGSGSAVSPCLRAFWDDTAFPSGVLGPVAREGLLMCAPRSLHRR